MWSFDSGYQKHGRPDCACVCALPLSLHVNHSTVSTRRREKCWADVLGRLPLAGRQHAEDFRASIAHAGKLLIPQEALYKKNVLLVRGRFRPFTLLHNDMLRGAAEQFFCETDAQPADSAPLAVHSASDEACVFRDDSTVLLELTTRSMMEVTPITRSEMCCSEYRLPAMCWPGSIGPGFRHGRTSIRLSECLLGECGLLNVLSNMCCSTLCSTGLKRWP